MSWGLTDVTKRFGDTLALDRAGIDVGPGAISAVVGGDGAGKSTLLKVCIGLVTPDEGSVSRPEPRRIGTLAEVPGVYRDLTVDEHLAFTAEAYGLSRRERARRAHELLRRAGLAAARDRLAGNLSGGMRQKLALILALLHEPDLLVLDEPTTGVDPVSRAEVWRLVGHAAAEGTAVLLATTYLDEAERAGEVLVLHEGRTVLHGAPQELTDGRRLEEVVIERQREAMAEVPA
ncbi:MAG: ABC transporter ATP-binding protein [Nitriliruptorales bacterium]